MATINDVIENLSSFNVREQAACVIKKNTGAMVLLNLSQLFSGEDVNGYHFHEYAPFKTETGEEYSEVKNKMNPRPGLGNPDLKFTGNFYRGIYAEVRGNDIIMDSRDDKSDILQEMYDEPDEGTSLDYDKESLIFGLQDKNYETFLFEVTFPDFKKEFFEKTGLVLK